MQNEQHNVIRPNLKPSRFSILLSAFLPGLGQAIQKRWPSAIVFGVAFAGCFLSVIIYVIGSYVAMIRFFSDITGPPSEDPEMNVATIMSFLAVALLIWIANMIDTFIGYSKMCSIWAAKNSGLNNIVGKL